MYGNVIASFRIWWVTLLVRDRDDRARPTISITAPGAPRERSAIERGRLDPFRRPVAHRARDRDLGGLHGRAGCRVLPPGAVTMELRPRVPEGPIERKWDKHRFDMKLVNPANKRKFTIIVVGQRARGRLRRGDAGGARLQREVLLLPGFAAACAQYRGAGRHQRGKELSERWRLRLPAVLRYGEGRRLPLARGERVSTRAAEREHHRSVRGAGGAVRARVRRVAGESLVRRRAGVADFLCAWANGAAAAAWRVSGARAPDREGNACACIRAPRCSIWW